MEWNCLEKEKAPQPPAEVFAQLSQPWRRASASTKNFWSGQAGTERGKKATAPHPVVVYNKGRQEEKENKK